MAERIRPTFSRTMLVIITALLTVLVDQCISGATCRFASTSDSQGPCIFPCRCTNGCNTITGECINGGQCQDGPPSGYRWSGPACQTGNVGYKKTAHQSGEKLNEWSIGHPASRAVDGNTDPDLEHHHHCAHPMDSAGTNAWWMVDLGQKYSIHRVVIYNRNTSKNVRRLDTFILSVGNNRNTLTQCASHNGRVASSGSVEKSCTAVGQYLRFRRNGGYQLNIASLCEVVIIGHLYIDCQNNYCSSTCNDVIGCDACAPGRQQPDCKKPCDGRTYGINCQDDCGHCKDNSSCNVENGHCTNGCKDWYISDVCKTHIPIPHFGTSLKPTVDVINSSSAVVSLSKANDIPPGLEAYYYYIVWLQADGGTWKKVAEISQDAGSDRFQSQIAELKLNTYYSVKVEPYRQHREKHEGGTATGVASLKTGCIGTVRLTTTTLPDKTSCQCAVCNSTAAGLGTGTSIIVAVATFLLGAFVATVVILIVFRMRSIKEKTDNGDQQRDSPSGNAADVVIDEQGYVVPPRLSRQKEDAIENEGDYVHPPTVAGQQEQANVYDVINPTA